MILHFCDLLIIDEKGEKTAVILPIEEYEKLLEDLHDLAIVAERRKEPRVSFDKLKEQWKENGIL